MQAQRVRHLVRIPGHTPDWQWLKSSRGRTALGVARAAGQLLLFTAIAFVVGAAAGELFGVKHPADPRYPGGATPEDIQAFVAMATVLIGLVLSGWRLVPGSLISIAGAIAFAVAIPDLYQTAVLLGGFGAANLIGWSVDHIQEQRHHHPEEQTAPQPKRAPARTVRHHPVGPF